MRLYNLFEGWEELNIQDPNIKDPKDPLSQTDRILEYFKESMNKLGATRSAIKPDKRFNGLTLTSFVQDKMVVITMWPNADPILPKHSCDFRILQQKHGEWETVVFDQIQDQRAATMIDKVWTALETYL